MLYMTQIQSFAFDPTAKGLPTVESSNDSVLRVVRICFDADQFCAIVHDSDRTRSLLLAAELFPVRRHVERGNDDLAWRSGRGRDPWEQQLSTRSCSRGTRRGGDGARIWRWASPEESSVVVDKNSEKQSPTCFWNHYCYKIALATSSFFATLIALNMCHGTEVLTKHFVFYFIFWTSKSTYVSKVDTSFF